MAHVNHSESLLLRNARVVLPQRVAEGLNVLVVGGRISQIAPSAERASADRIVELDGLTLFPGFLDVHIHGAVGVDTMEATPEGLIAVSEFLATQGVTGWLPTFVPGSDETYARTVNAIEEVLAAGQNRGSGILGVHYEGPFVNTAQCGALRTAYFKSYSSPAQLDSLPVPGDRHAAQMITVAPEIEGGIELIRELKKRGWVVSIGHTRADLSVLDEAGKAGARHLTHFMNAMPPLHHRSPGPVGWGLSRDDVTFDLIADGIHLDPAMLQLLVKLKSAERITLISDSIAAAGRGDGDYRIWDETIRVVAGRTQNTRGSIAGSVITMLDAVLMMRSLGNDEVAIARMAATNPAGLLGLADECGSIEEGKRADLVALNEQGDVLLTLVNGKVVFDQLANDPRNHTKQH